MLIPQSDPNSDATLIRRLSGFDTATVDEALGRGHVMSRIISPLTNGLRLCGRAVTAACYYGDNLMLHCALELARPGDVIVCDTGGGADVAVWGDLMTLQAQSAGVAGLVTNGSVRDARTIREYGFPVFCAGVTMRGPAKPAHGSVNQPVTVGGIIVNPGDVILGNDDGVIVVPRERLAEAVQKASERAEAEQRMREEIQSGARLYEMLKVEDSLKRLDFAESERKQI
ncbi:MAG: 4-carboxy-4-hydroxy-2-oxoadipate aldolase/oxaloacetate decarboxylase [Clostridia bacterium]|nr:4-carboxy-4-hydroxy-2-oxoadipate aldolase/oxaloacetate decarboxylase [Clostridia bacterium]